MRYPTSLQFLAFTSLHHKRSNCSAPVAFDHAVGRDFELHPQNRIATVAMREIARRGRAIMGGLYTTEVEGVACRSLLAGHHFVGKATHAPRQPPAKKAVADVGPEFPCQRHGGLGGQ